MVAVGLVVVVAGVAAMVAVAVAEEAAEGGWVTAVGPSVPWKAAQEAHTEVADVVVARME